MCVDVGVFFDDGITDLRYNIALEFCLGSGLFRRSSVHFKVNGHIIFNNSPSLLLRLVGESYHVS